MGKSTENDVSLRKDFVRCWVHAHPSFSREEASDLYDRLEGEFPHVSRGGHRGMVGRMKPWEEVDHECPNCGHEVQGVEAIKEDFGLRRYRGRVYVQSWCKPCRRQKGEGNGNQRVNPQVEECFTNGPEAYMSRR